MPWQDCPPGFEWNEAKMRCTAEPYNPGSWPDQLPGAPFKDPYKPPGGDGHKDPNDLPCPPGQCKDVVSGVCRTPNPNREKVNMTDEWERESGGGRGYCRKLDGGGGGGGGGAEHGGHGGGGGAGGGPGGAGGPGEVFGRPTDLWRLGAGMDETINGFLKGIIEGGQTRYSPEVMQDLLAGEKRSAEAGVANSTEEINSDLAARGLYRSPVGADLAAEARRAGDAQFSEGARKIRIEKAKTDFEDKIAAVDRAQANLNGLRSYIAQLDVTQAEREKLKATIELGYARIKAEMDMLLKQLASNKDLLGLSLASQERIARWGIDSSEWKWMTGLEFG